MKAARYVKLADRVDNLRDAVTLPDEKGREFRARYHDETMRYYLPAAEELRDQRLIRTLTGALARLREQLIADAHVPRRFAHADVELDLTRAYLPPDIDAQYGERSDAAIQVMDDVEKGEKVNEDEGREVGH